MTKFAKRNPKCSACGSGRLHEGLCPRVGEHIAWCDVGYNKDAEGLGRPMKLPWTLCKVPFYFHLSIKVLNWHSSGVILCWGKYNPIWAKLWNDFENHPKRAPDRSTPKIIGLMSQWFFIEVSHSRQGWQGSSNFGKWRKMVIAIPLMTFNDLSEAMSTKYSMDRRVWSAVISLVSGMEASLGRRIYSLTARQ